MDSRNFYSQILQVKNKELLDKLVDETKKEALSKGDSLIKHGEIVGNIYFLETGTARGYFLDRDGKEITDCFSFRCGETTIPSCRLELNVKSPMTIEALEASTFFSLPISSILRLLEEHFAEIILFYNHMLIHALEEHQKVKQVLNQYTALQRYQWFLKEYPGLIKKVNNKHIASFLGMTPITLSRIRKAIREVGQGET